MPRGVISAAVRASILWKWARKRSAGLSLYGLYTQRARSLGALNALVTEQGFKSFVRAMRRYPHFGIRRAAVGRHGDGWQG